jgi:hypothetical protein
MSQNKGRRAISVALLSGADLQLLEIATRFCADRGLRPAAVLQKPVRLSDVLGVCANHRRDDRLTA